MPTETKKRATNRFLKGSVMCSTLLETSEPDIIDPAINAPSDSERFETAANSPSPIMRQKIIIMSSCLFPDSANLRSRRGITSLPATKIVIMKLKIASVEANSSDAPGSFPDDSPESTTSRKTANMSSMINMPIAICA